MKFLDKGVFRILIQDNLKVVNEKIENAMKRSGRSDKVKLIAVTKTIDIDRINDAINLGVTDIGENKVQELQTKIPVLGNEVNYHMIGYLQTNKVKYIIDKIKLIHSLDRISLAEELDKRAQSLGIVVNTLVQINIAEEQTKSGLLLGEVIPFIESIHEFKNIKVNGLMTIGPNTEDKALLRKVFRTMYDVKEDIIKRNYNNVSMEYLSMGMTNDYEIAIEEGSNMVRVGTGIFGSRNY